MRQFELHRTYREKQITALVFQMQKNIHISLHGGDYPHIGAVGIVDPNGICTIMELPSHREGIICSRWTSAFSLSEFRPVVIEAGIHYDSLDSAGIKAVLTLTDDLLKEILCRLQDRKESLVDIVIDA